MKKKVAYIVLFPFLVVLIYEAYLFITLKGNTSIVVSGQNSRESGKAVVYINDIVQDTIALDSHFAYLEEHKLSFGKNKLAIKGINTSINYETDIVYIGLYNWKLVEFTENGFSKSTFYLPPTFE